MKYTELSTIQKGNCHTLNNALLAINLTNEFLRAGCLAVNAKESGLVPKHEIGYAHTPNATIIKVFKPWFPGYPNAPWTDAAVTQLKQSDKDFFNHVYSNNHNLGNRGGDDGYTYRGSGLNQITGFPNYFTIGNAIGVDLVNNPDELLKIDVAAKACAYFTRASILQGQSLGLFKARYGISSTKEINSLQQGATIAHQANMGWASTPAQDPTGGYQVVLASAQSYLDFIHGGG